MSEVYICLKKGGKTDLLLDLNPGRKDRRRMEGRRRGKRIKSLNCKETFTLRKESEDQKVRQKVKEKKEKRMSLRKAGRKRRWS